MTNDPIKEVIALIIVSIVLIIGFSVGIVYQLKQLGL